MIVLIGYIFCDRALLGGCPINLGVQAKEKEEKQALDGAVSGVMTHLATVQPFSETQKVNEVETYAMQLVCDFWNNTKKSLYPNTYFSNKHETQITNILLVDVFQNFVGATQSKEAALQRYLDLMDCLDKAQLNAKKQGWTSFLPPKPFFSKDFYKNQISKGQKGSFHYVIKWKEADKKKIEEGKKLSLLETAKNNIIKGISPRGRKDLTTQFGIILYYTERIKKLNDSSISNQFSHFISNSNNYNYGY